MSIRKKLEPISGDRCRPMPTSKEESSRKKKKRNERMSEELKWLSSRTCSNSKTSRKLKQRDKLGQKQPDSERWMS